MPRIVDHDARRAEIVHALWAVIHARGIDHVSLRAVAEAGGISVGRVQHYFATKDELVREGCRRIVAASAAAHEERTRRALGTGEGGAEEASAERSPAEARADLRELVRAAVPTTEEFRLGSAVWHAYLAVSVGDPEIARIVVDALTGARSEAAHLVARADRGASDGADSADVAVRLLATADGLGQRVLVGALGPDEALRLVDDALRAEGLLEP